MRIETQRDHFHPWLVVTVLLLTGCTALTPTPELAPVSTSTEQPTVVSTPTSAPTPTYQSTPQREEVGIEPQCVDCLHGFSSMTDRSLRLDSANRPHVAYGGRHLYYAAFDGTDWHVELVDDTPSVGRYASLALDSAGYPHIGYYDTLNRSLKYAHWTGEVWEIGFVADMGMPRNDTGIIALALDAWGNPRISYYDANDHIIKYAQWIEGEWSIQPITPKESPSVALSMVLDAAGYPHISYVGYGTGRLNYVHWTNEGWEILPVDNVGALKWGYASIAVDSMGLPHIGYYVDSSGETTQRSIRYASWTGTEWNIQTIGNAEKIQGIDVSFMSWYISLALDSNDLPHLVYGDRDTVRYAHRTGNDWSIQVVDDWRSGWYVSIVLDASDHPYISYRDAIERFEARSSYGGLKVARWTGTDWDIQIVDSGGSVGLPGIAIDSKGNPHVSYPTYYGVQYAHEVDGVWETQMVTETREVIWGTSIALDALDRPHVSYGGREGVYYAKWTEDGWLVQPVDDITPSEVSLALDATGSPHLSYYDYDNDLLKHAYWTEKGWDIQIVDSGCGEGASSLTSDSSGGWHIVYKSTQGPLQHAHLSFGESQWMTETIGSGFNPVLSLDTSDQPHVSYLERNTDGSYILRYAYKANDAWQISTVNTATLGSEGSLSLDMDTSGNPHLVYYTGWAEQRPLNYVHWTGTEWDIQTIEDSIGRMFLLVPTVMKLDASGAVHVCYLNPGSNDLLYARIEP